MGRNYTQVEEASSARVAVINDKTAESLFSGLDPIGRRIKIYGEPFTVIGVYVDAAGLFSGTPTPAVTIPHSTFAKVADYWRGSGLLWGMTGSAGTTGTTDTSTGDTSTGGSTGDTSTSSDTAVSASTGDSTTGQTTGDTSGETGPDPACTQLMQGFTDKQVPSGWEQCGDSLPHRVSAETCVVPATPSSCNLDGQACQTNENCVEKPFGSCQQFNVGFQTCGCVYGCETDADCPVVVSQDRVTDYVCNAGLCKNAAGAEHFGALPGRHFMTELCLGHLPRFELEPFEPAPELAAAIAEACPAEDPFEPCIALPAGCPDPRG